MPAGRTEGLTLRGLPSARATPALTKYKRLTCPTSGRDCAPRSIHTDTRRLDHLGPALDIARQHLGEVVRAALFGGNDLQPQVFEPRSKLGPGYHFLQR